MNNNNTFGNMPDNQNKESGRVNYNKVLIAEIIVVVLLVIILSVAIIGKFLSKIRKSEEAGEPTQTNVSKTVSSGTDESESSSESLESTAGPSEHEESPALSTARKYDDMAYYKAVQYNGHAYAVFNYVDVLNEDATFEMCEDYCETMEGHLAVITSAEENAFIYDYLREWDDDDGSPHAFFGYSNLNSEGDWRWVDGSDTYYSNWSVKDGVIRPNNKNGKEHYAQFIGKEDPGGWNDAEFGNQTRLFVCEWD